MAPRVLSPSTGWSSWVLVVGLRGATTTDRDRKRMIRLVIEDVTLLKHSQTIAVHIRFRGGATRSLSLPRQRRCAGRDLGRRPHLWGFFP